MSAVKEFFVSSWIAWKCRNETLFNDSPPNIPLICKGYRRLVADFEELRSNQLHTVLTRPDVSSPATYWLAPPQGFVKINTDASTAVNGMGVGVVLRTHQGQVLGAKVKHFAFSWSAGFAEILAVKVGVEEAVRRGLTHVILETDASLVVQDYYSSTSILSYAGLLLDDIRSLSQSFLSFQLSHVNRVGNVVAHTLARIVPSVGDELIFETVLPQGVAHLVYLDLHE